MIVTGFKPTTTQFVNEQSTIEPNWPVCLNGWVFVYKLSGWGFESRCCHLNFRYRASCKQGFSLHLGNYIVYIHSETGICHDNNTQPIPIATNIPLFHSLVLSTSIPSEKSILSKYSIYNIKIIFMIIFIIIIIIYSNNDLQK